MQVNLTAPFLLTHACLPLLKKSADASVIFTSSGVAHHGRAYWGAYGVTKAGCDNLMQILADEVENHTNIRSNSIDPGAVRTRMRRLAYPAEENTREKFFRSANISSANFYFQISTCTPCASRAAARTEI